MEWMLLALEYYVKHCGKNTDGTKKSQITSLIIAKNVRVPCQAKDVINKIQNLEKLFKNAWDYASSVTGSGVKEDDPDTFQKKLEDKCIYYFALLPIMGDCSSNSPKANSDCLDEEDEEELQDL